ncbi:ATP-binding protein [Sphaerisporangium rhizosphaerae]|uniref:ATP-binding protein n=1 Tax=Sphaerisporangium rhizosphaerae TaxID=2269375 RepID=A0ABW2PEZ8_9ACTN
MRMGRLLGVIELAGDPRSARTARDFVRERVGDGHTALDTLTLLVSEVVTNSVVHSDSRHGGRVTLTLADCYDFIHVDVVDAGGSGVPHVRVDESGEGGRGLQIVQILAARWGVRQDATSRTVWFQVNYERGRVASAIRATAEAKSSASDHKHAFLTTT